MKRIPSFNIDHTRLLKGLYVSRTDKVANGYVTTFDVRMKTPNLESMSAEAMHTIEHLGATFLRNNVNWAGRVIYWGPMGCHTGFYFIVIGLFRPINILYLMQSLFEFIANYEGEIPGASAVECGNYQLHSLKEAKEEADRYLELLHGISAENLEYPKPV